MKRKVARIGPCTLMVSLPAKWAKKYDIIKGSELELTENGRTIHIATSNDLKLNSAITIDVSGLNERVIRWYISALHKSGYDEIKILYSDEFVPELVKELLKNLLTGFAITEHNNKYILLKQVSSEIEQEFDSVLRRSFLVTLSLSKQSLKLLESGSLEVKELLDLELANNQLTNFCQRILNKTQYKHQGKTSFMYLILWNLEKIADDYKYISNLLKESQISPEIIEVYKQVNSFLESYYNLFYKFDINQLNELSIQGAELINKIKSIPENKLLAHYLLSLTQKIQDFSPSIIALNHN